MLHGDHKVTTSQAQGFVSQRRRACGPQLSRVSGRVIKSTLRDPADRPDTCRYSERQADLDFPVWTCRPARWEGTCGTSGSCVFPIAQLPMTPPNYRPCRSEFSGARPSGCQFRWPGALVSASVRRGSACRSRLCGISVKQHRRRDHVSERDHGYTNGRYPYDLHWS